jgi:GT2 family glycosyltransferase
VRPRVSFVIPVLNDATRLARCLRSIAHNRYAANHVDVVVVDNGSTDQSRDVARRAGAKVVVIRGASVSELRNEGARRATGDVLAFIDADNEITSGWVRAAIEVLHMPGVAAVGARCQPPIDGTWVQRTYGHLRGRPEWQSDATWLGSGNLAIWRDTFEAIGGFDTSLEACEDVDLCHRIRTAGQRIVSDPRLKNIHHGDPRTLGELLKSELWRGRDNVRVSFRPPLSWAVLPSAMVPIVDIMMIGVASIGLIVGTTTDSRWLLLSAAAIGTIAGASGLKVLQAVVRAGRGRDVGVFRAFVVALVYDLGRALALLARARHRGEASRTAPAAS